MQHGAPSTQQSPPGWQHAAPSAQQAASATQHAGISTAAAACASVGQQSLSGEQHARCSTQHFGKVALSELAGSAFAAPNNEKPANADARNRNEEVSA